MEQMDQLDDLNHPDHVKVSVDASEDKEFSTDDEDLEIESESENEIVVADRTNDQDLDVSANTEVFLNNNGLSGAATVSTNFDHLKENPAFQDYVKSLVAKEMKGCGSGGSKSPVKGTPVKLENTYNANRLVKSPSNTTIYVPALHRNMNTISDKQPQNCFNNLQETLGHNLGNLRQGNGELQLDIAQLQHLQPVNDNSTNIEQISNFIESVCQVEYPETSGSTTRKLTIGGGDVDCNQSEAVTATLPRKVQCFDQHVNMAKDKARDLILEAEQHKVTVNSPIGISANPFYESSSVKDDDEFLHITCHIDEQLTAKIERGEFVDLDKLLPKPAKVSGRDDVAQLVFKEGKSFFVNQTEKDRKISNVRHWEQAFRAYAAIYCNANPARASEIWQYVYIINKAASSFIWSNVLEYDFIFRQMMAKNPNWSWGKTYTQMWNVCMTDPLPCQQFYSGQGVANNRIGHSQGHSSTQKNNSKKDKPDYCWKFNKGIRKFGANCNVVNKCSYCDASDHGLNNCPKKSSSTANTTE